MIDVPYKAKRVLSDFVTLSVSQDVAISRRYLADYCHVSEDYVEEVLEELGPGIRVKYTSGDEVFYYVNGLNSLKSKLGVKSEMQEWK